MKKIAKIFSSLVLMLTMSTQAFAVSASLMFSGDGIITGSGTTTVNLAVSGVSGLSGVCGVSGVLSYDKTKIEMAGASGVNGFSFTQGNEFVAYRSTCINKGNIIAITFKNKGLSDGGSTNISFTGVRLSSDSEEISVASVSKKITYKKPASSSSSSTPSSKTSNNSSDTKKTNNTTKKEQSVKTPKSNDSSLSSISLSVGKVDFRKDVFNYDLIVGTDVNYIEIEAKSTDSKANVLGTGKYDLNDEKTEIKLIVTAEDGMKSTYFVNVYKDSKKVAEETTVEKNDDGWNLIIMIVAAVLLLAVVMLGVLFAVRNKNKK